MPVGPVCLPLAMPSSDFVAENMVVAGWGKLFPISSTIFNISCIYHLLCENDIGHVDGGSAASRKDIGQCQSLL